MLQFYDFPDTKLCLIAPHTTFPGNTSSWEIYAFPAAFPLKLATQMSAIVTRYDIFDVFDVLTVT